MVLFHLGQKSFTILTGSVCALCIQGAAQVLSSPYKLSSIALSTSLCIDVCKDVTDMKKSTFSIVTFYLLFFPLQRELFYDNKFYLTCVILAVCPMSFVFLYLYVDISEIQNANKLIWSLAHTSFHLVRHLLPLTSVGCNCVLISQYYDKFLVCSNAMILSEVQFTRVCFFVMLNNHQ